MLTLLRIKKDDSTMKRGLKELAKEVGVTPSYLCRVFKKIMGVTLGTYMREFEREASEVETECLVGSRSKAGSALVEVDTGLLTPDTTANSPSLCFEGRKGEPMEDSLGSVEEALDLDFDLDEWFLNEDLSNDSIYEEAI